MLSPGLNDFDCAPLVDKLSSLDESLPSCLDERGLGVERPQPPLLHGLVDTTPEKYLGLTQLPFSRRKTLGAHQGSGCRLVVSPG